MKVHSDLDNLPEFRKAVITIGTFDGVHLGHRKIIDRLKSEAAEIGGETVIVTFHPHPRQVVSSAILGVRLINTLQEKISLLEKLEIDHLVIVPFTEAFANQTAPDYIDNFLVDKFRPHTIIIGYDHRFGRDRKGDYRLLEESAPKYNFQLREIPKHILEDIAISSTNIRESILHSQVEIANRLLGYEFFFSGIVVDGDKLGRKLGYPTANIRIQEQDKLVPGNGIYAVYVRLKGETGLYKGMMSIGFRPTVDGSKRVIEVNLFNFDQDIYGAEIQVIVKKWLRDELKFDTLEDLVKQMDKDKVASLEIL